MFLFPLLQAKSLVDLALVNRIFDEYKTIGSYPHRISLLLVLSVYVVQVLRLPLPESMKILRTSVYGSCGWQMAVVGTLASCQVLVLRVWFYVIIRRHLSIERIAFVQLMRKLDLEAEKKVHFLAKLISLNVMTNSYIFALVLFCTELYFSIGIWHGLFISFHFATLFCVATSASNDVVILYVYAFAGCNSVLNQMKQLLKTVKYHPHLISTLSCQYEMAVQSVQQLNSLTRFLVLVNELLVVPLGSMCFMLLSTPTDDLQASVFKMSTLAAVTVFVVPGYLLTAKLAQVDEMRKKLYTECNSSIARRGNSSIVSHLKVISEDASCLRSHLVLREFSGRITQRDTLDNILSTLSIVMLFFSFQGTSIEFTN